MLGLSDRLLWETFIQTLILPTASHRQGGPGDTDLQPGTGSAFPRKVGLRPLVSHGSSSGI